MPPNYFVENNVAAHFERHLSIFKDKPVDFLQIGVFTGDASVWLLENILTNPESSLTDVDTWEGSEEHEGMDFVLVEKEYDRRVLNKANVVKVKTTSDEFFKNNNKMFDFIYIDGNHSEDQVFKDGSNAITLIKDGGIIAFDDYFHAPIRAAISDILDVQALTTIELSIQQAWFKVDK